MVVLEPYTPEKKGVWDRFVDVSKNGTFLFKRDFLEHHAHKYDERSFFIYQGNALRGLFPANISNDTLYSHQFLTYGGVISDEHMKTSLMLDVFVALKNETHRLGCSRIVYKCVPHIYHALPAEEDLYALFRMDARLIARGVSSTISHDRALPFNAGRRWRIKKARDAGTVRESQDFAPFMDIVAARLEGKYGAMPAHTAEELTVLASRFPRNVRLFVCEIEGTIEAGVVVFETERVAHAQYISATERGRKLSAIDLVLDHVIHDVYREKPYFDFGISTEEKGRVLNESLIRQKEELGGRAVCYDIYEFDV